MQTNMRELLERADNGKYAVVAFNYSDIWDLKGIVTAAEREKAPVIVQVVPPVVENIGIKMLSAMGRIVIEDALIPVVNHLDHSSSKEMCFVAIDHGFTSVMIDASDKPFWENVEITKSVVDYAHKYNVHVEGELGLIKGAELSSCEMEEELLTRVDEAVRFVAETGVDSLAISIGSAHGFYTSKPKLNIKRLSEINSAIDTKLVLHGGTGIPSETIREAINNGINKINVGTIIYTTYMKTMRKQLNQVIDNTFSLRIHNPVVRAVSTVVQEWLRTSWACGKA